MVNAGEKRILVIDDEPDVRSFFAACIEDAGFMVETAIDGNDALDRIKANLPDLITLDMIMPRKSGIRLMRTLRQNPVWAHIPVIVISAHVKDEFGSQDIKELRAFTVHHRPRYTLEKPVTPQKLVAAIQEILAVEINATGIDNFATQDEREAIVRLIKDSDDETLKKIRALLRK